MQALSFTLWGLLITHMLSFSRRSKVIWEWAHTQFPGQVTPVLLLFPDRWSRRNMWSWCVEVLKLYFAAFHSLNMWLKEFGGETIMLKTPNRPIRLIPEAFGVANSTIWNILKRETGQLKNKKLRKITDSNFYSIKYLVNIITNIFDTSKGYDKSNTKISY